VETSRDPHLHTANSEYESTSFSKKKLVSRGEFSMAGGSRLRTAERALFLSGLIHKNEDAAVSPNISDGKIKSDS